MKFVIVQFPDATDITTLAADAVVAVGTIAGGIVIMAGTMQNPPVVTPTLVPHTHTFDAPASVSGPAIP